MKVSEHFDASEFNAAGEVWPDSKAGNRAELARLAEFVRFCAGNVPGIITSAGRTPEHNERAGGTDTSQHMKHEAIDVLFPLAPLRRIAENVLAEIRAGRAPKFGQIIIYPDKGHVHISLATLGARNGEVRYSVDDGTGRVYPMLTDASQIPMLSETQAKGASGLALLVAGAAAVYLLYSVTA